ncbi:MAG: nucleotidyltransferase domain-containing protein [Bacteroidetes bacterium]|nr:nucleotidyltransferase domain-containing protein [Bacteroidota bacterium]
MIANIVQNNLGQIKDACERYNVISLYLFGSAVTEDFKPQSDLDFLVEYAKDKEGLPLYPFDYFDFLFMLEKITGRKVDLVVQEAVRNSYFKKSLNEQKVLIYDKGH